MDAVLTQLRRTDVYSEHVDQLADLTNLLISSASDEDLELRSVIARMVVASEVIPLDAEVAAESLTCQTDYGFAPQDALVYASVMGHIRRTTPTNSCLLNRDAKDFDDQNVVDQLTSRRCKLLTSFDDGLKFVQSHLNLEQTDQVPTL